MKKTLLILLLIAGGCLAAQRVYSQQYSLIGASICTDGTQSTNISLSDSDPQKLYSLYRDDQFLEVKGSNTGKVPNAINFGEYTQPGQYYIVEFTKTNVDTDHPENGKKLPGSVNIYKIPVAYVPKELKIRSGLSTKYQPRSNIENCTYEWTARLEEGKASGFQNTGEGVINDTIILQSKDPALVIYTVTPFSPRNLGGCMGQSYDFIVRIIQ